MSMDLHVSKRRREKTTDAQPGSESPGVAPASTSTGPHDLILHLWKFRTQYREGRDADKLLRAATRLGMDLFNASEGAVVTVEPGTGSVKVPLAMPDDSSWDRGLLADFLRGEKVRVPDELMLARVRRHGRMWGALAIRAAGTSFHWDSRQAFSSIGSLANELIDQIDRDRIREVRARVDRKILEQSHPKHLAYELLHGIRSLTGYDHSATLLIHDGDTGSLEVVAEQIAWQKAK
jgi:two-component system NtrC family sensor kinase